MTQPNLFQEIEADIERQRLEDLWRRVGPYVIAAAIAVMAITGGYSAWHSWNTKKMQAATEQFLTLTEKSPTDDATTITNLEKFAEGNPATTQSTFALFQAASIAAKQGDKTKALSYYASIASNTKNDTAFRQLSELYSVQLQMDEGNAGELLKKLEPLSGTNSSYRPTALELSGYLYLKQGERDKARAVFKELTNNAIIPRSISDRASHMLRYLGE